MTRRLQKLARAIERELEEAEQLGRAMRAAQLLRKKLDREVEELTRPYRTRPSDLAPLRRFP